MYGQIGRLETDADGKYVQRHACGRWYKDLARHALVTHSMNAGDCRVEYGLNRRTALASPVLRAICPATLWWYSQTQVRRCLSTTPGCPAVPKE